MPSLNRVIRARSCTPRRRRCSTATRMFCSETPVSSNLLTTLRTRMSLNEYSRWLPEPEAPDGWRDQIRPCPVVELAIGDPGNLACCGTPIAEQMIGNAVRIGQDGVGEQGSLLGWLISPGLHEPISRGVRCAARSVDHRCLPRRAPSGHGNT